MATYGKMKNLIQHVDGAVDNPDLAAAAGLSSGGFPESTFTIKDAEIKTALVEQAIAKWLRLGGVGGPGAPRPFQQIGGPLTGAVVKALLLGGLGQAAGRYLTPMFSKRLDPRKVGNLLGGLGALAGSAIHIPGLIYNLRQRGLPGINFHPSQMLGSGEAGAGIQPGQLLDRAKQLMSRGMETASPYVERGLNSIRPYLSRLMGKSSSQIIVKMALTPDLYQQDIDTFISSKRYLGTGATATLSRDFLPGGQPYGAPTLPSTRANIAVSDWIHRINQDPYMSPLDKARAKFSIEKANFGRGTGLTSGYDVAKAMIGHGLAGLGAAAAIGQLMSRTSDLPTSKKNKLWGIGLIGGALHGYLTSRR